MFLIHFCLNGHRFLWLYKNIIFVEFIVFVEFKGCTGDLYIRLQLKLLFEQSYSLGSTETMKHALSLFFFAASMALKIRLGFAENELNTGSVYLLP